jgi:hypothetical protein
MLYCIDFVVLFSVRVQQEANTLQIEGVYVEHPRAKYQLKTDTMNTTSCYVCATGLEIKHTVSSQRRLHIMYTTINLQGNK